MAARRSAAYQVNKEEPSDGQGKIGTTKPFAFVELLARVRALLRRGGPQHLARLKAADLELDPASRRAWRAGREVTLTNKEYALLEFFLRNKNRTPLTVLQANLEVTLNKARTIEEYRDALINNLEHVERLVTLTRELLTLTRLAGDRTPVRRALLHLQSLLQELIDELRVLAEDRQIGLSLQVEPTPLVLGDAQWLKQAVINLLDNAIRCTPSGRRSNRTSPRDE